MSLSPLPTSELISQKDKLSQSYRDWFQSIQTWLGPQYRVGVTGGRPTTGLYIGLMYFDTTLGFPVFLKTIGSPNVWVNASGAPV
jgi:hypothetical protein